MVLSHKIWLLFLFTISGLGFSNLIDELFNSVTIGGIAGFYGIINYWLIYAIFYGHNLIIFSYALTPFALKFFLSSIEKEPGYLTLCTGILTGLILLISPQIGYILCIAFLVYTLIHLLTNKSELNLLAISSSNILIVYSVGLAIFLPTLSNVLLLGTEAYTIRLEEMYHYLLGYGGDLLYTLLISIIVFFSLFCANLLINKKYLVEDRRIITLTYCFLSLTIFGVIIYSNFFPFLMKTLYTYIPGFSMLRESHKFMVAGVYLNIIVFSLILSTFRNLYVKKMDYRKAILAIILITTLASPILLGDYPRLFKTVDIPESYIGIYDELSTDDEWFRVAYFPPATWVTKFSWSEHYFLDPAISLQPKPSLEIKSEIDTTLGAQYSRWLYHNIYKGSIGNVETILGLTGVKSIVQRNDSYVDPISKTFNMFNSPLATNQLHGTGLTYYSENVSIYKVNSAKVLPHIFGVNKVSLIAGDRRMLISITETGLYNSSSSPFVFSDNLYDSKWVTQYVENVFVDPHRFEDLVIALADDVAVFPLWEQLPPTSNIKNGWINGGFSWFLNEYRGMDNPDGHVVTISNKTLQTRFKTEEGEHRVQVQCFVQKEGAAYNFLLNSEKTTPVAINYNNSLGAFHWLDLGVHKLEKGLNTLSIVPLSNFSAASKIAIIPERSVEDAVKNMAELLKEKMIYYLIDDWNWNINPRQITRNTGYSYGSAVSEVSDTVSCYFPEETNITLRIANSGEGSVKININNGKTLEKTYSFINESARTPIKESITVKMGWNNISLTTGKRTKIDYVILEPENKTIDKPTQIPIEKVSDSKYKIGETPKELLVFLEGFNSDWVLEQGDSKSKPAQAMGFANLYQIPEETGELKLIYKGYRITRWSMTISFLTILSMSLLTIFLRKRIHKNLHEVK